MLRKNRMSRLSDICSRELVSRRKHSTICGGGDGLSKLGGFNSTIQETWYIASNTRAFPTQTYDLKEYLP
jgi:hypothetical protein